jgi:outer membrane protein TolC
MKAMRISGVLFMISAAGLIRPVRAFGLEEYLKRVQAQNSTFESIELGREAAEARPELGDLELSPIFESKVFFSDDQTPPLAAGFQAERTLVYGGSIGLKKQFSTGTALSLDYGSARTQLYGMPLPFTPRAWAGDLNLGFQQSLWRNGFGASTRRRRERETITQRLERLGLEARARQTLMEAESAYWDYLFALQDLSQKKDSLGRAERLRAWMQRRLADGIADRSDALQLNALYDLRRLELVGAEDGLKAARRKVADFLQVSRVEEVPELLDSDISAVRDPVRLADAGPAPLRIDAYLKVEEAKVRANVAAETNDAFRPDLKLQGLVGLNSKSPENPIGTPRLGNSLVDFASPTKPIVQVALALQVNLDRGGVERAASVSRAEADAAKVLAERALYESKSAWTELVRRHGELSNRVNILESLSKTQSEKAAREQERLARGRTTTFQVVNFEQDAADARLNLLRLKAEQRKIEAASRLFVAAEDNSQGAQP